MVKKIKFFCSLQKKENKKQGRWSQEEQDRFLKGCYFFKNDWEKIKDYIKTRTIPQIRSHAQKYLIKICRKYSIKLSKKKFSNRLSKHLDITKMPYKGKCNISNMSIYEKNILEMFNYYNREVIQDDKIMDSNNINNIQLDNLTGFANFTNPANINNININLPQNSINLNNLSNSINLDKNGNILDKDNKDNTFDFNEKIKDLKGNNFLLTLPNLFPSNILPNVQNNNNLKSTSPLLQSLLSNSNNSFFNLINYNIPNMPINFINQNKFFIQNEYEFYLMQKISYFNSLLLNYIKTNQKINENILMLLGYDSNKDININDTNVNDSNVNNENNNNNKEDNKDKELSQK